MRTSMREQVRAITDTDRIRDSIQLSFPPYTHATSVVWLQELRHPACTRLGKPAFAYVLQCYRCIGG